MITITFICLMIIPTHDKTDATIIEMFTFTGWSLIDNNLNNFKPMKD